MASRLESDGRRGTLSEGSNPICNTKTFVSEGLRGLRWIRGEGSNTVVQTKTFQDKNTSGKVKSHWPTNQT